MRPVLSRRRLLLGGAVLAASATTATWAEAGQHEAEPEPGLVGNPPPQAGGTCRVPVAVPDGPLATRVDGTLDSRHRGRPVPWTLLLPPGVPVDGLPLVLVLPGRRGPSSDVVDVLRGDAFLPDAVRAGAPPCALLGVGGGTSYWHPRAGGDDPIAMLTDELLPAMRERGLDPSRLGLLGWSMGGFGALLLARESAAGRLPGTQVRAACAGAPALFGAAQLSSRGAFDSRADFARWGRLADRPGTGSIPLMVDCGIDDRFVAQVRRYRASTPFLCAGAVVPGCHSPSWFRSLAPAQLRFLAGHLW